MLIRVLLITVFLPGIAFARDGELGRASSASSEISIIIPERALVSNLEVDGTTLLGCGEFSIGTSFVLISPNLVSDIKVVEHKADDFRCKGASFYTTLKGNVVLIVPSWNE